MACNCGQAAKREPAAKQVTKRSVSAPTVRTVPTTKTVTRRVIKRPAR